MYKNRRNRGLGTWPCHSGPNQQFPCQGTKCCCADEGLTDWCVHRHVVTPPPRAAPQDPALPPAPERDPLPRVQGPAERIDRDHCPREHREDRGAHGHRPLVFAVVAAVLGMGWFGAWFIMHTLLDDDMEE